MSSSHIRRPACPAVALAFALLLAGCAGGGPPDVGTAGTASSAAEETRRATSRASDAANGPDDPTPPAVRTRPLNEAGLETIVDEAIPLRGNDDDYDELLAWAADAEVVLIGEASHGTHEFYRERAEITQRLIAEASFDAVVVEAAWPHAYRVDRYVRGRGQDRTAEQALAGFRQFPTWMWRNDVVAGFAEWLRDHNAAAGRADDAGFYGMDVYSLLESIDEVVAVLDQIDPDAAQRARDRYACFAGHDEAEAYGRAVAGDQDRSCADVAEAQLEEVERLAASARGDDREVAFSAARNAAAVRGAEAYFRTAYAGGESSWNLRDRHMFATLEALRDHLGSAGRPARLIVWAHNTHVGDARATEMARRGELNVGQLAREAFSGRTLTIGFTTYTGTVTAAREWGGAGERRTVLRALNESFEALFHEAAAGPRPDDMLLDLRPGGPLASALDEPRLERAIGVLYLPETERFSHYFQAKLPEQFDAVIHVDTTTALRELDASEVEESPAVDDEAAP